MTFLVNNAIGKTELSIKPRKKTHKISILRMSKSKKTLMSHTCVLNGRCGMGRLDGAQGSKSNGDPFKTEIAFFPSPILFHTRALWHSSVII